MDRSERIIQYLKIKPVNHGQVYTFQIAIPPEQSREISPDRYNILASSLSDKGSNLMPLVVRRTEEYNEDFLYEIVYGTDWLVVAQNLDIEKLWVWVFEMTDEQASAAQIELAQIFEGSQSPTPPDDFSSIIDQKLSPIHKLLNQMMLSQGADKISSETEKTLLQRISEIEDLLPKLSSKIDNCLTNIFDIKKKFGGGEGDKINLKTASYDEIFQRLVDERANSNHAEAACRAVQILKSQDRELTWRNLMLSTKSGSYKVDDFGNGTYEKLRKIGEIK